MNLEAHKSILNITLGDLLKNNTHAQGVVMNAMQVNTAQFQELLKSTENNQYMSMTIGELFKQGIFKQAQEIGKVQQVSPDQFQQITSILQNSMVSQPKSGQQISSEPSVSQQFAVPEVQDAQVVTSTGANGIINVENKQSFIQKIKDLFR